MPRGESAVEQVTGTLNGVTGVLSLLGVPQLQDRIEAQNALTHDHMG